MQGSPQKKGIMDGSGLGGVCDHIKKEILQEWEGCYQSGLLC